jgi:hypothetical protein
MRYMTNLICRRWFGATQQFGCRKMRGLCPGAGRPEAGRGNHALLLEPDARSDSLFCFKDPFANGADSAMTATENLYPVGCCRVSLSYFDSTQSRIRQYAAESVLGPSELKQAPRAKSIIIYYRAHARDSAFQDTIVRDVQHRSKSERE